MAAGVGFSTHSGWAVAITARLDGDGHLCLVDRRRVELIDDDLPRQAYHAAAGVSPERADALVVRVDDSIAARARAALDEIVASCPDVSVVAVVGEPRDIPDVATVLASHARMHACEGEQYRRGIVEAAGDLGLPAVRIGADQLAARLVVTLDWAPGRVEHELTAVRAAQVGPPWQKDHKDAALAAVVALRSAGTAAPQPDR